MSSCSFVIGLSTSQPENLSESAISETVLEQDNNTLPQQDEQLDTYTLIQLEIDRYIQRAVKEVEEEIFSLP